MPHSQRPELSPVSSELESRYRLVVESALEVFYQVAFTGHPPQAFVDNPGLWIESIHPDDRQALAETTMAA